MNKICRYELSKTSKKEICPQCRHKTFKRYVDKETGAILPLPSGRCDRENNCGYHSCPYKNGESERLYQENKSINTANWNPNKKAVSSFHPYRVRKPETPVSVYNTIPNDIYLKSGMPVMYDANPFILYLREYFGNELTNFLIREYGIGNSLNDKSATVFWQLSYHGEIRTGKKFIYRIVPNPAMFLGKDIKRVKDVAPYLVHKKIKQDFNVCLCFFGEHLLKRYPAKSVIMVEAEKSAIIASVFFPEFVCIATGGSAGCKWATDYFTMKPLIGRNVLMYPDLKNTEDWVKKAAFLKENGVNVMVKRNLIDIASPEDFENDNDLADYLLRLSPPKLFPHSLIVEGQEVISSPPAIKEQPILSLQELNLEKMKIKNPSVNYLIESLDLELV